MDLRRIETPPNEHERAAVDEVLGALESPPSGSLADARAHRHLLLPVLHAIQSRIGWISPGALGYACQRLEIPPAEAYGVASFYALFALSERGPVALHVCDDIACKVRGADALCDELEKTASGWHRSSCLGLCDQAPAALLTVAGQPSFERGFGRVTAESARRALADRRVGEPGRFVLRQAGDSTLRLLARAGKIDPGSLDEYRASGGYRALRRAFELGPTGVLRELEESGLVGRGGAAFPTALKWQAVAQSPVRPHYLVCNADESEPGTFKDRVLIEQDPFALIEAMTIAALAIGAERGFVYLRAEYPTAAERLGSAIATARARGLLGSDVMGRGLSFDLELRRGAGAYVCGEETALLASIEGERGEPRNKPPFPVQAGLFGKPTVINNVETLANVPFVIEHGAAAYRSAGTSGSPGTRLFCLSGSIEKPGVYEAPLGITLGTLIGLAGGVAPGRRIAAVLLGGAAGSFVGADALDLPLTFEDTKKAGVTLGSGAVLVLDDTVSIAPLLARIARFFREESCGQCVPCRVGTVRQEELVTRLTTRTSEASLTRELALLSELGQAMRDASICGLGQTASAAIESAVTRLRVFAGSGA